MSAMSIPLQRSPPAQAGSEEHLRAFHHFLKRAAGQGLGFQKFQVSLGGLLLKGLDRVQPFLDDGQGLVHVGIGGWIGMPF